MFLTTFCFSSNCVWKILVQIYLLWPKLENGSGVIHSSVACSADIGYNIFSLLLLLRPLTVHYWNMQGRRNQLLCATSERDYKLQHWIEMLALPRQNTIMPLSSLLHRVRRFYDVCLNIACFAFEKKRVKQKFSTWISLSVITKYVQPYFQLLVDKGLI